MTESETSSSILIATIDQSTTATKFVVFDTKGNLLDKEIVAHQQITLHPGWLEHDPEEILTNTHSAIAATLARLAEKGYSVSQIKTIGVTNQRETVLAWNRETGKPYHNAIVWSDTRTQDVCKRWLAKHENNADKFSHVTGLPINTYFSAFKIQWLLENVPLIKEELSQNVIFGTMDSWVIWNLTNRLHLTDVTNASRTFLLDLNTLDYHEPILEELGITRSHLPKVLSSAEHYGVVSAGLLKGISIDSCIGDQQAASLGHGLFEVGQSKNTYGTGCFFLVNAGTKPVFKKGGLLTTVMFKLGPDSPAFFALEGAIEAGGSSINWARDNLGLFQSYSELQELVESAGDTGGLLFVPSFSGIFSPYWREDATGSIFGLTLFTKKEHILRALLEGIAFRTKDVVKAVESCTGTAVESLKVDGGLTNSSFLMQFQADVLQRRVLLTSVPESTCLGAAFAAGLATKLFSSIDDIKNCIKPETEVKPNTLSSAGSDDVYEKWLAAVHKTLGKKE